LAERNKTHGDFCDDAHTSQDLKRVIQSSVNWHELSDIQREALHLIATKISRILSGNPNHADSWHDIAGYAELVAESLIPASAKPEKY